MDSNNYVFVRTDPTEITMVSCLKYGLDGENEWQRHPYREAAVRMIEGDLLPALVMGREEGCSVHLDLFV